MRPILAQYIVDNVFLILYNEGNQYFFEVCTMKNECNVKFDLNSKILFALKESGIRVDNTQIKIALTNEQGGDK